MVVISETGRGIMETYRKIEKKSSRKIFFSHLNTIIIGEALAKDGVSEILDFFSRYREATLRTYVLFTKEEAKEILKIKSNMEAGPVEEIKKKEDLNISLQVTLRDFIYMLTEQGSNPITAEVEKTISDDKSTKIGGAAVFIKDKLVGWLNDEETRGVLWIKNNIETGIITINLPEEKGGGKVAGQILKSNTKITPVIDDNIIKIEVSIQPKISVYENTSKLDLSDPNIIKYLEKLFSDLINKRIQLAVKKTQKELNADVLGFGKVVFEKYPKEWKNYYKENWNEEFKKANVSVESNVMITETGFYNKSLMKQEEEFMK